MALEGVETLQKTPVKSAFSPAQIQHYLQHISFPLPLTHPRDAYFLQTLHRCQITSIPYENLSLHYNASHSNSIDPQTLFAKFLPDFGASDERPQSSGRGGFCFETSVFFLHVLRGVGFTAYPTSARIRIRDHFTRVPAGPFVGPLHVVNIVLLDDGSVWSCDVGFGGDGPTSPLRLATTEPGQDPECATNLGAQYVRLRKGFFPDTVKADSNPVWFYEYRNGKDAEWNTYYAFGETEASEWDLDCANWWVSTHPESFQRTQVLVVKFLRGQSEINHHDVEVKAVNGEKGDRSAVTVIGKLMLADGVLKRNMGGKTEVVKECRAETERLDVLRNYFDIHLTVEQEQGIRGYVTELKE